MIVEFFNTTTRFYSKDGHEPSLPDNPSEPTEIDIIPYWSESKGQFQHHPEGNLNNIINKGAGVSDTTYYFILDLSGFEGKTIKLFTRTEPSNMASRYMAFASALKSGYSASSLCKIESTLSDAIIVNDNSWYFGAKTETTTYVEYELTIPIGAKYLISSYNITKKDEFYAKVVL